MTDQNNGAPEAPVTFEFLMNSLKIPDAIKSLPEFNGNARLLFDFVSNVEEILGIIEAAEGSAVHKIWMRAIRNKIVGNANEVLDTYGTTLNWPEIKSNLTSHYSDKRNEMSLIGDLHKLFQKDTIENFYCKIIELLSNLNNQVNMHETNPAVKASKITLYHDLCLNSFVANLKEPLGSVIRARAPNNLKQAFEFCITEQNIHYSKKEQNLQRNIPNFSSRRPNNFQAQGQQPRFSYMNQTANNFPQNSHFTQSSNIAPIRHQVAQQQQYANQPNRQFQSGNQNRFATRPTPMEVDRSGFSKISQNSNRNQNNFSSKPQFRFEELRTSEINSEIIQNFDDTNNDTVYEEQKDTEVDQPDEQDFQFGYQNQHPS